MKPPFAIRLVLFIPLTVLILAVMTVWLPVALLFGQWTYKGKEIY